MTSKRSLDLAEIQHRSARDAAKTREQAEARAHAKVDGRKRRRKNRTEVMTFRFSPERRQQIERLSDIEGCTFVETMERALDLLEAKWRGQR